MRLLANLDRKIHFAFRNFHIPRTSNVTAAKDYGNKPQMGQPLLLIGLSGGLTIVHDLNADGCKFFLW